MGSDIWFIQSCPIISVVGGQQKRSRGEREKECSRANKQNKQTRQQASAQPANHANVQYKTDIPHAAAPTRIRRLSCKPRMRQPLPLTSLARPLRVRTSPSSSSPPFFLSLSQPISGVPLVFFAASNYLHLDSLFVLSLFFFSSLSRILRIDCDFLGGKYLAVIERGKKTRGRKKGWGVWGWITNKKR